MTKEEFQDLAIDPSNIEEAAEKYAIQGHENHTNVNYINTYIEGKRIGFIAGAEWMAGQGETQQHFVIGSIADSPCGPAVICYTEEFSVGDEVIVQIRKK